MSRKTRNLVERYKVLLPVMEAFLEGAEVQWRYLDAEGEEWKDTSNPTWMSALEYRIKPKKVEAFLLVTGNGTLLDSFLTKEAAYLRLAACPSSLDAAIITAVGEIP